MTKTLDYPVKPGNDKGSSIVFKVMGFSVLIFMGG
jgi:hypothetical protein